MIVSSCREFLSIHNFLTFAEWPVPHARETMISIFRLIAALSLTAGTALSQSEDAPMPRIDPQQLSALQGAFETQPVVRVIVGVADGAQVQMPGSGEIAAVSQDVAGVLLMNALPADQAPLVEPIGEEPLIMFEVTRDGFDWLLQSDLVGSIQPDGLAGIDPVENPGAGGAGDLAAPQ